MVVQFGWDVQPRPVGQLGNKHLGFVEDCLEDHLTFAEGGKGADLKPTKEGRGGRCRCCEGRMVVGRMGFGYQESTHGFRRILENWEERYAKSFWEVLRQSWGENGV